MTMPSVALPIRQNFTEIDYFRLRSDQHDQMIGNVWPQRRDSDTASTTSRSTWGSAACGATGNRSN